MEFVNASLVLGDLLIAQRMGLLKRAEAIGALLKVLEDESGEVRYRTIMALGELEGRLNETQREVLREHSRRMVADADERVRLEALIRVEGFANKWLSEARESALRAQLTTADSLFHRALAYFPHSKHAAYQQGRFYFDNGQEQKGMSECWCSCSRGEPKRPTGRARRCEGPCGDQRSHMADANWSTSVAWLPYDSCAMCLAIMA